MNAHIVIDGERHALRLTLGALAEIEEAFGGVEALAGRLAAPRALDLLIILHALLQGGGARLTLEALKGADIDLAEAGRAIARAFRLSFQPAEDSAGKKPAADGRAASPKESL
jgi:hypothetical protein